MDKICANIVSGGDEEGRGLLFLSYTKGQPRLRHAEDCMHAFRDKLENHTRKKRVHSSDVVC